MFWRQKKLNVVMTPLPSRRQHQAVLIILRPVESIIGYVVDFIATDLNKR